MTKSFKHRRLIEALTGCLAACLVAVPGAIAHAQSDRDFISGGPIGGLHYGVPLKWSIALGYALPGTYSRGQPFAAAEPGIGGWRASVGALKITNQLGGGYVARATVLRTGNKAWRAPSQSTYLGPELQVMPIFAIGVRVGGFLGVGHNAKRGLLTADLSLMF